MPQSLSRIVLHLIFSTKNRTPVLTPAIRSELHPYMAKTLTNIKCPSMQVGGVADHVHLLFGMARTLTVAEVVESVKTSSSKWIKTKGAEFAEFHWQNGYGIFSVKPSEAPVAAKYIENQESHHETQTFQNEYRQLLRWAEVEYDERYVWD